MTPRRSSALDLLFALVVVSASVMLTGCYSKATGAAGKLTIAYASGVEIENFVKPIAPGSKLDVVAFEHGSDDALAITAAVSSKPSVLAVDAVLERGVTLAARAEGVAEIEISARDAAGTVLVDKMFFHVVKPKAHRLEHECTSSPSAAYVRGDRIYVSYGLETADHRQVIGYGDAPLRIEPPGALELVGQPQGSPVYVFDAPSAARGIVVRSTIDDAALNLRVVSPGELTEASLDAASWMLEGDTHYVVAHVRLGETPLCSQNALTKARSLTPEICAVTADLGEEPGGGDNRDQLALVTGLAMGTCKLEVTLPELAGGRGVVLKAELKVGRVELPRDEGHAEGWWSRLRGLGPWLVAVPIASRDVLAVGAVAALVILRRVRRREG